MGIYLMEEMDFTALLAQYSGRGKSGCNRSTEKVYKEFMLYTIVRNINKYHRFLNSKL
mgnify:CR=1 FL=1